MIEAAGRLIGAIALYATLLLTLTGGALAQGLPTPTSSWCVDNSSNPPFWKLCSQLAIAGGTRVELSPTSLMVDTFNAAAGAAPLGLDTNGTWNSVNGTAGGISASTYSQGQQLVSSGTVAAGVAYLQSKRAYQIPSPSFLLWRGAINFQVPEVVTNCKIMGLVATLSGSSQTCAAPITDGVVFEVTAATTQGNPGGGKLQAVIYASGTRQLIADLSVQAPGVTYPALPNPTPGGTQPLCPARQTPQPTADTCPHILDIWFNGNSAEFDVDFQPVAFMKVGSLGPNNNGLAWTALAITTAGGTAATVPVNQAAVGDESRGELKQLPYFATNITATTTSTTIKASSGVLHSVCINTPAASSTLQLYDSTTITGSPAKIGLITEGATAPTTPWCMTYDILFNIGLTIVAAGGAPDYTISWR